MKAELSINMLLDWITPDGSQRTALLVRGIRTEDIMSPIRRTVHTLTPFAKVRGTTITYPAEVAPNNSKKSASRPSTPRRSEHLIHTGT